MATRSGLRYKPMSAKESAEFDRLQKIRIQKQQEKAKIAEEKLKQADRELVRKIRKWNSELEKTHRQEREEMLKAKKIREEAEYEAKLRNPTKPEKLVKNINIPFQNITLDRDASGPLKITDNRN